MENYRDNFKESIENFNKVNTLSYRTKTVTPKETVRKWYLVDAENQTLGRISSEIAKILQGKNKPSYTPNIDTGDHVIVINCDEAVLTGKKLEKKYHRTHSGWIGGLKETQYKTLMAEASDKAMTYAVKGMVPSNTLGAKAMTRLHCYKTAEHAHAAQKPEVVEF